MKTTITISMVFLLMGLFLNSSHAFSRKQCSIWLCLLDGCRDAYAAMKKRLRKGQSVLPPLASCTVLEKIALKAQ